MKIISTESFSKLINVKMSHYVYKITNIINNKIYIGCTSLNIRKRFKQHISASEKGRPYKICRAIRKHGIKNFQIKKIKTCSTSKEMFSLEKIFIKKYDSLNNGYNMTLGGEGFVGGKRSEKHKKILLECITGRIKSEEEIRKISEGNKGNKNKLGFKCSDETKKKISKLHKGKVKSKIHRRKLSKSLLGNSNAFGYNHKRKTKKKMSRQRSKRWRIIYPGGEEFIVINLRKYCFKNDLIYTSILKSLSGFKSIRLGKNAV